MTAVNISPGDSSSAYVPATLWVLFFKRFLPVCGDGKTKKVFHHFLSEIIIYRFRLVGRNDDEIVFSERDLSRSSFEKMQTKNWIKYPISGRQFDG